MKGGSRDPHPDTSSKRGNGETNGAGRWEEEEESDPGAVQQILQAIAALKKEKSRPTADKIVAKLRTRFKGFELGKTEARRHLDLAVADQYIYGLESNGRCSYFDPASMKEQKNRRIDLREKKERELSRVLVKTVREWCGGDPSKPGKDLYDIQRFLSRTYTIHSASTTPDLKVLLKEASKKAISEGLLVSVGRELRLGPKAITEEKETAAPKNGTTNTLDKYLVPSTSTEKPEKKEKTVCGICRTRTNAEGHKERLLTCATCANSGHPSCLKYSGRVTEAVLGQATWLCRVCRACEKCGETGGGDVVTCDACDRLFHHRCLPSISHETRSWLCQACEDGANAAQARKATKSAAANVRRRYLSNSPKKRHTEKKSVRQSSIPPEEGAPVELKGLQDSLSTFFTPSNKRRSRVAQSSYADSDILLHLAKSEGNGEVEEDLSPIEKGRARKRPTTPLEESGSGSESRDSWPSKRSGSVQSSTSPRKRQSQSQVAGLFDSLSVYFAADQPRRNHPNPGKFAEVVGMKAGQSGTEENSVHHSDEEGSLEIERDEGRRASSKISPRDGKRTSKPTTPRTPPVSPVRKKLKSMTPVGDQKPVKSEEPEDVKPVSPPEVLLYAQPVRLEDPKPQKKKSKRPISLDLSKEAEPETPAPKRSHKKGAAKKEMKIDSGKKAKTPEPKRPPVSLSRMPDITTDDRKAFEASQKAALESVENLLDPTEHRCPGAIQFGAMEIQTWYSAPYPQEYARLPKLFVCEFCLKYMKSGDMLTKHGGKCRTKRPPGTEVYRAGGLSVFQVDGQSAKIYCQNMCLLAKLFLDHKTLYYDVEPFLFYVLTKNDSQGSHFIGYFSKEKYSVQRYNLSCIVTLPCFQGAGYGRFLIDFSFLLSRREGQPGTPERPLSHLGKISYHSYWKAALLEFLHHRGTAKDLTVKDLSKATGLSPHDIVDTLQSLAMLQRRDGKFMLSVNRDLVDKHWAKVKADKRRIWIQEKALKWTPQTYPSPTKELNSPMSPVSLAAGRSSAGGHRSPIPIASPLTLPNIVLPGGSGNSDRSVVLKSPVAAAAARDLFKSQKRRERKEAERSRRPQKKKKEDKTSGRKKRAAAGNVCYTETSDSEEERQRAKLDRSLEEEEEEEEDSGEEDPLTNCRDSNHRGGRREDDDDSDASDFPSQPPPTSRTRAQTARAPSASSTRSVGKKGGGGGGRKAARHSAAAKRRQRLRDRSVSSSSGEEGPPAVTPSPFTLGRVRPTSFGIASKPSSLAPPAKLLPLSPTPLSFSPPRPKEVEDEPGSELMEEEEREGPTAVPTPPPPPQPPPLPPADDSGADSEESNAPVSDEEAESRCSSQFPASEEGPPTLQPANHAPPDDTPVSLAPVEERPEPRKGRHGEGSGEESPPPLSPQLGEMEPTKNDGGEELTASILSKEPTPEPTKAKEDTNPLVNVGGEPSELNESVNAGGGGGNDPYLDLERPPRAPRPSTESTDAESTLGGMLSQSAAAVLEKLQHQPPPPLLPPKEREEPQTTEPSPHSFHTSPASARPPPILNRSFDGYDPNAQESVGSGGALPSCMESPPQSAGSGAARVSESFPSPIAAGFPLSSPTPTSAQTLPPFGSPPSSGERRSSQPTPQPTLPPPPLPQKLSHLPPVSSSNPTPPASTASSPTKKRRSGSSSRSTTEYPTPTSSTDFQTKLQQAATGQTLPPTQHPYSQGPLKGYPAQSFPLPPGGYPAPYPTHPGYPSPYKPHPHQPPYAQNPMDFAAAYYPGQAPSAQWPAAYFQPGAAPGQGAYPPVSQAPYPHPYAPSQFYLPPAAYPPNPYPPPYNPLIRRPL